MLFAEALPEARLRPPPPPADDPTRSAEFVEEGTEVVDRRRRWEARW